MSISDRLDGIEARANAATEGPWEYHDYFGVRQTIDAATQIADTKFEAIGVVPEEYVRPEDAEFIAHARTDVPALTAAIRAVLDLHKPLEAHDGATYCDECVEPDMDQPAPYPCPTVRAVTAALDIN